MRISAHPPATEFIAATAKIGAGCGRGICARPACRARPGAAGPRPASSVTGVARLCRVLGKGQGASSGTMISLDIHERHSPLIDLPLRAFQGRSNGLRLLDVFAIAAECFGHAIKTSVPEVAAGLVAGRVGG